GPGRQGRASPAYLGWSWWWLPPWSQLPSPLRRDTAPHCEAASSPHIRQVHLVGVRRRTPPGERDPAGHGSAGPASPDLPDEAREKPMTDFQAIADRVEIEALRGDFSDAVMMGD